MNQAIPYILGLLALIYLTLPHIYECYVSYSRPWNTREEMTNADIISKQEFHADKPTVWEMFDDEVKTNTPDVPSGPIGPSNKKELEPAIDRTPYLKPEETEKPKEIPKEERASKQIMDPAVQKPNAPAKVLKVTPLKPTQVPTKSIDTSGREIRGPKAPMIDYNEPKPTDSNNNSKNSGVYPHIYGPEMLEVPGNADGGDSSNPPAFDYVPAAEFPAGPFQPSPYLNDFSKMLKT
jgi:hypothetical protein